MVGPSVLTFVKEMGEFFGPSAPPIFGFIDSLEAVDIASPGLEFLEGSYLWEGNPRFAQENQSEFDAAYREAVGVDENGASVDDPRDVSTYAHMFGCWETLNVVKAGMEAADYRGPDDRSKLVEAVEAMEDMPHSMDHPQGAKTFNGKTHQVFGHQYISRVNRRAAGSRAHHLDRGHALPRRGRLHDPLVLTRPPRTLRAWTSARTSSSRCSRDRSPRRCSR